MNQVRKRKVTKPTNPQNRKFLVSLFGVDI